MSHNDCVGGLLGSRVPCNGFGVEIPKGRIKLL